MNEKFGRYLQQLGDAKPLRRCDGRTRDHSNELDLLPSMEFDEYVRVFFEEQPHPVYLVPRDETSLAIRFDPLHFRALHAAG